MNDRPIGEEQYKKGTDIINFVVYKSKTGPGNDQVLQHKLLGTTETAHVTLHPDGTVNIRTKRTTRYVVDAIRTNMVGYKPGASAALKQFLMKVRHQM